MYIYFIAFANSTCTLFNMHTSAGPHSQESTRLPIIIKDVCMKNMPAGWAEKRSGA